MLNNFRNLNSLYKSLGVRWLAFRVGYALRMRTGLIRRQMPAYRWEDRPLGTWLKPGIPSAPEAYAQWRREYSPDFFFRSFRAPDKHRDYSERSRSDSEGAVEASWNPELAVAEAERILNGDLKYFAHQFIKTGFPPDWHRDPFSGVRLDADQHWSEISNDADVDIKFIWEASRFSMVYTLVRAYAFTRDEKFAAAFWELIGSWAESNPPNTGPNWMDGQEMALRLLAWTFGFYAFLESPATTSERIAQFTVLVAAQAQRIHKNIEYAISTHSNHTISEAFGLWLVGTLFPELKESAKYRSLGHKLLEQEALAQIFPDGGYAMYSLNYHRFILHVYLCGMRLADLNGSPFSGLIIDRISASIAHLSRLIDPETGQMPVYGSNDGALVLPLNNCDFTDYRPLLQLGSYLTQKQLLFAPGPWDEDLFWLCGSLSLQGRPRSAPQGGAGGRVLHSQPSFPQAGIYLLHGDHSKAIIRCTHFRSRPSHADQLHVDLWWQGYNIACDAGTYLYSSKDIWRNGLAHTAAHNTVTVDRQDQMKMVSRFTWTKWANGKVLQHTDNSWQGEHDGYQRLPDPVNHSRTVLSLGGDRWLVVDHLEGKQPHHYALHWLLSDFPYKQDENSVVLSPLKYRVQLGLVDGTSAFSIVRADSNGTRGWRSQYYGEKEPALSVMLETTQPRAIFWSFFGADGDSVKQAGSVLNIEFMGAKTSINLQAPIANP
ncbi:MAG TPA: alginate lyase family protein [Anaerolineales bacterium]|nr:alginate lyase family protein [Anaerolineales bacterium]